MSSKKTKRSFAEVTTEHLDRLSAIAREDHDFFTRPNGRPEFADRRVAVVLAQGGASHYLDGQSGVKDLRPVDLLRGYSGGGLSGQEESAR